MRATLENRDLLVRGKKAVEAGVELGELLTQQHRLLRDALEISTPRIERMLDAALAAGATGGKINGSGGGGCAFVTGPVGSGNAIADSVNGVVPEGGGRVLRIIPGEPGVRCA
jgi:galactokinase